MSKILNNVIGSTRTLVDYLEYSKANGLIPCKPSINISSYKFVCDRNLLYIPFNAIKSIGDIVAKSITDERINNGPYKSFDDFKLRHPSLSKAVVEALVYAGAFDEFGKSKKSLIDNSSLQDSIFNKHLDDVIVFNSEYPIVTLKEKEFEYLGMNIEYNIFKDIQRKYKENKAVPFNILKLNGQCITILAFSNIREIKTKASEIMLVGNAVNDVASSRFVCFASDYSRLKPMINEDTLYAAIVTKSLSNKEEEQLVIKDLKKL
jgi:DNA polymerase-3 subunit alpha